MTAAAILYLVGGVLFLIGSALQFAALRQRCLKRRAYCVQFRLIRVAGESEVAK